jgi:hypothetical protein
MSALGRRRSSLLSRSAWRASADRQHATHSTSSTACKAVVCDPASSGASKDGENADVDADDEEAADGAANDEAIDEGENVNDGTLSAPSALPSPRESDAAPDETGAEAASLASAAMFRSSDHA